MIKHPIVEKLRIPLSQLFAVLLMGFIAFSTSAWEEFAPFMTAIIFFVGAVLVAIASLGRLWCSLYIAGYKTRKVVTEGPYSLCRHPLYFFSLLGAVGVGLATETFLIPTIILIVFAIYYPYVIRSEEAELKKLHGEKYKSYINTTPTFFPKISYLIEPKEYNVNPIIFRKHVFSALWFVWLIGILELIEEFHTMGIIPVLFKIY